MSNLHIGLAGETGNADSAGYASCMDEAPARPTSRPVWHYLIAAAGIALVKSA